MIYVIRLYCLTHEQGEEVKVTESDHLDGYKVVFIHKHELSGAVFVPHVRIIVGSL